MFTTISSSYRNAFCAAITTAALLLPTLTTNAQTTNDWVGTGVGSPANGRFSELVRWAVAPDTNGVYQTNVLRFLQNPNATLTNDFLSAFSLVQMLFQSTSNYTITGGTLNFTNDAFSGLGARLDLNSNGSVTINSAVALSSGLTVGGISTNTAATATVAGWIYDTNGVNGITKEGVTRLILSNQTNSFGGGLTINSGAIELRGTNAGGSGNITINGGELALRSNASATFGPGSGYSVTLNNNALITVGRVSAFTNVVDHRLTIGTLNVGQNVLTVTGTATNSLAVNNPVTLSNATINVTAGSLYHNSSANIASGLNTFTGTGTNVFLGAQVLSNISFFGGPVVFNGVTNQGGNLRFEGASTLAGGTNIFAMGTNAAVVFNGAVSVDANQTILVTNLGTIRMDGAVTITGPGTNVFNSAQGVIVTPALTNNNNPGSVTINGAISESGGQVQLLKQGTLGTLILTTNNTFSGGLVIQGGAVQFNSTNGAIGQAGLNPQITLTGAAATLNLRSGGNVNFTNDLVLTTTNNGTISSGPIVNGTGNFIGINSVTLATNNATLVNNTVSNYTTVVTGPVTLVGNGTLNAAGNLQLNGGFIQTNRVLTKAGAGVLFYNNNAGGIDSLTLSNTAGNFQWNYLIGDANPVSVSFTTNRIALNAGGFRWAPTNAQVANQSASLNNIFQALGASSLTASQLTNASGFAAQAKFTGTISNSGTLTIGSFDAGQTVSAATNIQYAGKIIKDSTALSSPASANGTVAALGTVRGLTYTKAVNSASFYDADLTGNIVDTDGGSQMLFQSPLVLNGGTAFFGVLNIKGANNTYDGGTLVNGSANGGMVNVDAASVLGTGDVTVNPLGRLRVNGLGNLAAGKKIFVNRGGIIALGANADLTSLISSGSGGVLTIDNTTATPFGPEDQFSGENFTAALNMSAVGNGRMFLGSTLTNGLYAATSLGAGLDNLYRLGGPGTLIFTNNANILSGANTVQIGAYNGQVGVGNTMLNVNANAAFYNRLDSTNTTGTIVFGAANNYSGQTILNAGTNIVTVAGGLGTNTYVINGGTLILAASGAYPALGEGIPVVGAGSTVINLQDGLSNPFGKSGTSGAMHIYGTLLNSGTGGTLGGLSNFVTHPGGIISLDNTAGNNVDRWDDGTPLILNGATLRWANAPAAVAYSESIGTLTVNGGAVLNTVGVTNAGGSSTLSVADIARSGNGTLRLTPTGTGAFDLTGNSTNRILSTANPALNNGIVAPWIINGTSNTFVSYDPTVGFSNAFYSTNTLNSNAVDGATLVNQNANVTLTTNRTAYAVRAANGIAGLTNSVSIISGGLSFAASVGVGPALVFTNAGGSTIEALINVGAGLTGTISNSISANGITKFGTGTLSILGSSNSAYASGYNVNEGVLQANAINSLGTSVAGNFINLNGGATLNLNSTGVTNSAFTGGPITMLDFGNVVRVNTGVADVTNSIPNITLNSLSAGQGSTAALIGVNSRNQNNIGTLTANDHAVLVVSNTAAASGSAGSFAVGSLAANNVTITKIGGSQLILSGNNTTTFGNSGPAVLNVNAGALGFAGASSFGGASAQVNIGVDAVLDIRNGIVGFVNPAQLTQLSGSSERWGSALSRFSTVGSTETVTLGSGVGLQLNSDLVGLTNKTINLNGGMYEAFDYTDSAAAPFARTNGLGVTLNVAAPSYLGRGTADQGRPISLVIEGAITGSSQLIKVGTATNFLRSTEQNQNSAYTGGWDLKAGILQAEILSNAAGAYPGTSILGTGTITIGGGQLNIRSDALNAVLGNNIVVTNIGVIDIARATALTNFFPLSGNTFTFGSLTDNNQPLTINTAGTTNNVVFTGLASLNNAVLNLTGATGTNYFNGGLNLQGFNSLTGNKGRTVVNSAATLAAGSILADTLTQTLDFNGGVTLNGINDIRNTGTVAFNSTAVDGTPGSGIMKEATGVLAFTNWVNQSFTGGITVMGGTVRGDSGTNPAVGGAFNLPFGTNTITLAGGTLDLRGNVPTGQITVGPGSGYAVVVNSNSTISYQAVGAAVLNGTNATLALNTLNLGPAILTATGANSNSLRFNGAVTLSGNGTINPTVAASPVIFMQPVDDGASSFSLTKTGGGNLLLTNYQNSTYDGGTVLAGGSIVASVGTNLAATAVNAPLGTGSITYNVGGPLDFRVNLSATLPNSVIANTNPTFNAQAVTAAVAAQSNNTVSLLGLTLGSAAVNTVTVNGTQNETVEFRNAVTMQTNTIFTGTGNSALSGGVGESATGFSLMKLGAGVLSITNSVDSTYTGGTAIRAGTLRISASPANTSSLGTGGITISNATLDLRSDTAGQVFGPAGGYSLDLISNATVNVAPATSTSAMLLKLGTIDESIVNNGTNAAAVPVLTVTSANAFMLGAGTFMNETFTLNGSSSSTLSNAIIRLAGAGTFYHSNTVEIADNSINQLTGGVLRFDGTTTLKGSGVISNAGTLILNGLVNEASPGVLVKTGAGTLFITNYMNNTYAGGSLISGGTVQIAATNAPNQPLGTGAVTLSGGAILQLRADTNMTFGPGGGYNINVAGPSVLNADRITAAALIGTNSILSINSITGGNLANVLAITAGNTNFVGVNANSVWSNTAISVMSGSLIYNGTVNALGTSAIASPGGTVYASNGLFLNSTVTLNTFSNLSLVAPINDGGSGPGSLRKIGLGTLNYSNVANPTFSGGLIIEQGSVVYRSNNAAGNVNFGAGSIAIDGAGTFDVQANTTGNYTNNNPIIISERIGATNGGYFAVGGTLGATRQANNPVVIYNGALTLGGDLGLASVNAGATNPLVLAGPITITGGNRQIRGNTAVVANGRFVIAGNITNDGTSRDLYLQANNAATLELAGSNSVGVANMHIMASQAGNVGRVRFSSSNALPAGLVYVDSGSVIGFTYSPAIYGPTLAGLGAKLSLSPNAILALDGVANSYPLDLSATGLNADVFLGASEGSTITTFGAITPFASTVKLGGGNGTINVNGTNAITGSAKLWVNPAAADAPIALAQNATVMVGGPNDYTGGTVVRAGTFIMGRSNSLGSGAVENYGTFQPSNGVFASYTGDGLTNLNAFINHPGSSLRVDLRTGITNRWGDNDVLALNGSTFELVGTNAGGFTRAEYISNLTFAGGSSINLNNQFGLNTNELIVSSLARVGNGTLLIQGIGTGAGVNNLGLTNRVVVLNAPAVNAGGIIAPYIVSTNGNNFLTYNGALGGEGVIGLTNFAGYAAVTTLTNGSTVTTIPDVTASLFLNSNVVVNALRQSTGIISNAAGTRMLTNISGGYIVGANATNQANNIFSLADGTRVEALIHVANGATLTLNTGTNDAAGITKFGAGTLQLAATTSNNIYAAGWNVNQGQITVNFSNGLGLATAGNFVNLNGGATLLFNQSAAGVSYTSGKITSMDFNNITFNLGAADRTASAAPLGIDINSIAGGSLGAGLRFDVDQSRSLAVITGPVTVNADATLNIRNIGSALNTTGGTNRVDFAGGLVGAGKSISKIGNGILGLPSNNSSTWTGGNIDVMAGALAVGNNGSLGNAASTARIRSGAVLELDSALVNFAPLATVTQDSGSAERWKGPLNRFSGSATTDNVTMGSGVNLQLVADLTGLANKTINLDGGSIEAYRYVDSQGGNTVTVDTGVTLNLLSNSKIGQSGVDMGRTTNVTLLVNGQITGPGSLTKTGVDTVNLTAANTYGGGTIVDQGLLLVNNTTGSGTGDGPVTVGYNGTFGGSGTIAGAVTVKNGGKISPGNSPGKLTVAGLTLNAGATLVEEINGSLATDFDQIFIVGGGVTLGGNLNIVAPVGISLAFSYKIVDNDGVDAVNGIFAGLPQGSSVIVGGQTYFIDYLGGDGNDIVLAVPEPGQMALMMIGGALVGWQVIRRRRNNRS